MIKFKKIIDLAKKKKLQASLLLYDGGSWLGCAREWIQRKFINGDDVTWGSHQILRGGTFSVSDIEYFAAQIAAATLNEFYDRLMTEGEAAALKIYLNKENWSSYVSDEQNGNLVVLRVDRNKMHFLAAYAHKHGWDIAGHIDKKD